MTIKHYLLILLIMALFGSAFVFGKLVLNTNVPPLLFGSLRMLVVVICLLPFFDFKIPKENLKSSFIFSFSMGVGVTGFTYLSLQESNIVSPVIIGSQLAIPFAIILAFTTKGISLYFAKLIMINVGEEVKKIIQIDMLNSFIKADTETIESKHSGNYVSNLNFELP